MPSHRKIVCVSREDSSLVKIYDPTFFFFSRTRANGRNYILLWNEIVSLSLRHTTASGPDDRKKGPIKERANKDRLSE